MFSGGPCTADLAKLDEVHTSSASETMECICPVRDKGRWYEEVDTAIVSMFTRWRSAHLAEMGGGGAHNYIYVCVYTDIYTYTCKSPKETSCDGERK